MLDGGPARTRRPRDDYQANQPQTAEFVPAPDSVDAPSSGVSERPTRAPKRRATGRRRGLLWPILSFLALGLLVVLGFVGWNLMNKPFDANSLVDSRKFQAVFLTDGTIYFGRVQFKGPDFMRLTEVYYIQPAAGEATKSDAGYTGSLTDGNMRLVKRGAELHSPEDAMVVNNQQILFIEDLKPSGKITNLINEYKQKNP